MGRGARKRARKVAEADGEMSRFEQSEEERFPPAAGIAVNPQEEAVAIAAGSSVRVLDKRTGQLAALRCADGSEWHPAHIVRCIAFDPSGKLMLTSGDDKCLQLWDTSSWTCQRTLRVAKKVSAATFTHSGKYVLLADRFGDVFIAPTDAATAAQEHHQQEAGGTGGGAAEGITRGCSTGSRNQPALSEGEEAPHFFLGHWNSILTCLALSSRDTLLASTDRDGKVRVTRIPRSPLRQGGHSIASICLGHTSFVMCCAFLAASLPSALPDPAPVAGSAGGGIGGAQQLLVTGGGDGTVRLWQPLTGEQLCCLDVAAHGSVASRPEEEQENEEGGEEQAVAEEEEEEGDRVTDLGVKEEAKREEGAAAEGDMKEEEEAKREEGAAAERDMKEEEEGKGEEEEAAEGGKEEEAKEAEAEAEGATGAGEGRRAKRPDRQRPPDVPSVLSLAVHPSRQELAVVVEGCEHVLIVTVRHGGGGYGGKDGPGGDGAGSAVLKVAQKLRLPGVPLPGCVHFDESGRLWATAGPLPGTDNAVVLGCASSPTSPPSTSSAATTAAAGEAVGEARGGGYSALEPGVDGQLAGVLPSGALQLLQGIDFAGAAVDASKIVQVSAEMKKKFYKQAEREGRKANRNDVRVRQ